MKRASKRGSMAIFFCLIMAAIMLVFGTLLQAASLRATENDLSRAMSAQIRASLAAYDTECRQFGLFGFSAESIDKSVFQETLPTKMRSIEVATTLQKPLTDPDVLQFQIVRYMKGRVPAVYLELLISRLTNFKSSLSQPENAQAGGFQAALDGLIGDSTASEISSAAQTLFGDLLDQLEENILVEIESNYRQYATELLGVESDTLIQDVLGQTPDFLNPESISSLAGNLDQILNFGTIPIYEQLCFDEYILGHFKPAVTQMITPQGTVDLMTMDGRYFKDFGESRSCEAEQILTGFNKPDDAEATVKFILTSLRSLIRLIWILTDQEQMAAFQSTAVLISAAITAASVGYVKIDPQIITYLLAVGTAIGGGIAESSLLMEGKMVNFWPGQSEINVRLHYLDYLRLFFLFIPQATLVQRIGQQLERVLTQPCYTALTVRTVIRGRTYSMSGGYIDEGA